MKTKNTSIGKNYLYNVLYEVFLLIVPFVITPYISRTLGAESTGAYSFTLSIVTYFMQFASLGFDRYAQRLIAGYKNSQEMQSKSFWEIIICRLFSTILCLGVFLMLIFLNVLGRKYFLVALILSFNILSVGFDSVFFFQGNEQFRKIIIRNIIIKTIGFASIFVFVKSPNDLIPYTIIQSAIIVLSNMSLWFCLPKSVFKVKAKNLKPFQHLKPALILFLPTIAISVYTSLDKTLIGLITHSDLENGYYEYSEKIVKMALTIITALGTVMVPRNSQLVATEGQNSINVNIYKSIRFVFVLGLPLSAGLVATASNFVPWYLGAGYSSVVNLIKVLSPIIFIIGLSNVFGTQYLIPTKQDLKFTLAIIAGALTNLGLNFLLIPNHYAFGASIATLLAETIVTLIMFVLTFKKLELIKNIRNYQLWKPILGTGVMFVCVYKLSTSLESSITNSLFLVGFGIFIYLVIMLTLKDSFVISVFDKATRFKIFRK